MGVTRSVVLRAFLMLGAAAFLLAADADKKKETDKPAAGKEGEVNQRDADDKGGKKLPQPTPDLKPEDVVKLVMEALQKNDDADHGIATAFNFASPDNKKVTGPLERFIPMVKTPAYKPMLNYKSAAYAKVKVMDDHAVQVVTIVDAEGEVAVYGFQLSKQADGDQKGCWMTDGVIRLQPEESDEAKGTPVLYQPSLNGNGRHRA